MPTLLAMPSMDTMRTRLGRSLRGYRREQGISQAELAHRLRVTRPAVHYYETGQRFPETEVLERIFALGVIDPNYLFGIHRRRRAS